MVDIMTQKGWEDEIDLEFEEETQIVNYRDEMDYKEYVQKMKPDV